MLTLYVRIETMIQHLAYWYTKSLFVQLIYSLDRVLG